MIGSTSADVVSLCRAASPSERVPTVILALDQGTSSTKACLYAPPDRLLGAASVPVRRYCRAPGAVEQDPHELVESCRQAARGALRAARVATSDVAGVALANQGESFRLFTPSGEPRSPVIGWQDGRCGDTIDKLDAAGARPLVEHSTGLRLHAEFTAPKLAYQLALLDSDDEVLFGTLDTWLIHQLDPSRPHVTDRATASRTMLVALGSDDWSEELLDLFDVPRALLPEIVPCDAPRAWFELDGQEIPLVASGYDMGLGLLGHGCLSASEAKATFGTCLGVMAATGEAVRAEGLLTTIAYTISDSPAFALDGEIAAAGSLIEWALRLGVAQTLAELESLATSVPDAAGAVLVPALGGLGAPHWQDSARARLVGLSDAFERAHFAHAVFDAIAWSLRDVLAALGGAGFEPAELRVDGGLANSDVLLQWCADCCGVPLVRGRQAEATAYGAAALGMLALGLTDIDEIARTGRGTDVIDPSSTPSSAEQQAWESAIAEVVGSTGGDAWRR
jgi:glycerol kinase